MDSIYKIYGNQLINNKDLILSIAKNYDKALAYASDELLSDEPFIAEIINKNGACLAYANDKSKDDATLVLAAVRKKGKVLKYANARLKEDPVIVLEAVKKDGRALKFASKTLLNNKEIILKAVENNCPVEYIPAHYLTNDSDVILRLLANKNSNYRFELANTNLRNDAKVVSKAVEHNGLNLEFASPELQNDIEIVRKASKQNFYALEFTSLPFSEVTPLIYEYINGRTLGTGKQTRDWKINESPFRLIDSISRNVGHWYYASDEFKCNKEIVLVAIQINSISYDYICKELQIDRDIVLAMINHKNGYNFLDKNLPFLVEHFKEDLKLLKLIQSKTAIKIKVLQNYEKWKNPHTILERWMLELDTSYLASCQTLFYPGAEYDFSTLQFFMENSGITDFYYTDYMNQHINEGSVLNALRNDILKDNYQIEYPITLTPEHFNERNWDHFWHSNERANFGSDVELSFITKITIRKEKKSWNLFYFGTESIATFQLLLDKNIKMDVVVTQDHGLGGCWTTFCKGSFLEQIAKKRHMLPQFLLSGQGEPWENYIEATDWFGEFGMHKAERKIYKRS